MPSPLRLPVEVVVMLLRDLNIFDLSQLLRVNREFKTFISGITAFQVEVAFLKAVADARYRLGSNARDSTFEQIVDTFFHLRASRSSGLGDRSYCAYLAPMAGDRLLVRIRDGQMLACLTPDTVPDHPETPQPPSDIYMATLPVSVTATSDIDLFDIFDLNEPILHVHDRVLAFNISLCTGVIATVQGEVPHLLVADMDHTFQSTLALPWPSTPRDYCAGQIELLNHYSAIFLHDPWRFVLYDWMTGSIIWSLQASPQDSGKSIVGFSFLSSSSSEALLLLETGPRDSAIRLYRVQDVGGANLFDTPSLRLALPPLQDATYVNAELRTSMGAGSTEAEFISNGRLCVIICSVQRVGFTTINQFALFFLAKFVEDLLEETMEAASDGLFNVPWNLWGPDACRVLDLGPEIKVYPNALCGLRAVLRQRLSGSAGTWPAQFRNIYLDFGDLSSLTVIDVTPRTPTVTRGCVRGQTSIAPDGLFSRHVLSRLPFSFTCDDIVTYSRELDVPEVFMDDSKVVKMSRNDPDAESFDFNVFDF